MAELIELKELEERLILTAVSTSEADDTENSLDELAELVKTAGAVTIGRLIQNREKIHPGTYLGKGKIEELRELIEEQGATGVVCDDELSPAQLKNLEELLDTKVMDRTMVILDIFAAHATTSEGKIQVELAQLKYRAARLVGMRNSLSRLGGGIGTRGPGEKKLETDRRLIHDRIGQLKAELSLVKSHREVARKQRERNYTLTAAIVGYTNAGKSTLFNRLTDSNVYVMDQLFATLDSVSRPVTLPHGGKALLVDTVGFIRKLPHDLVQAFRATLEEARLADVLVLVCDGADRELENRHATVEEVLDSLGATQAPRIVALNKCDLFEDEPDRMPGAIRISATAGENLEALLERIEAELDAGTQEVKLLIPFENYGLINRLHTMGTVLSQQYGDQGVVVSIRMEAQNVNYVYREGAKVLDDER